MGGRYLLSDERGPRGVFMSEQNKEMKGKKKTKQNKDTELGYSVRM